MIKVETAFKGVFKMFHRSQKQRRVLTTEVDIGIFLSVGLTDIANVLKEDVPYLVLGNITSISGNRYNGYPVSKRLWSHK